MEWQPIETAPRDGGLFLCLFRGWAGQRLATVIFWDDFEGHWRVCDGTDETSEFIRDPTHWMPLSEPPEGHE